MSTIPQAGAELLPCPFCNKPLHAKTGKINPYAVCRTERCFGSKMPVVSLDVESDVQGWNTRLAAPAQDREAIIEECAKVADDHTPLKFDGTLAAHVTGRSIASAIRDLALLALHSAPSTKTEGERLHEQFDGNGRDRKNGGFCS